MNHGPEIYSLKVCFNLSRVLEIDVLQFTDFEVKCSLSYLAHVRLVHVVKIFHLSQFRLDRLDCFLDLLHPHVEQCHGVLIVVLHLRHLLSVKVLIIIVINFIILDLHLKPDYFVADS